MSLEREFEVWLDDYWPLWRQHHGNPRWHDLRKAFFAGFKIGDQGPSETVVAEMAEGEVSMLAAVTAPTQEFAAKEPLTEALIRAMTAVRAGKVRQRYTTDGNIFEGPKGIGAASYRRLEAMKYIEDVPNEGRSGVHTQQLSAAGKAALDDAGARYPSGRKRPFAELPSI